MTKARDLANSAAAFAAVSATELGYVDGVTSAIQTQMDAKAPSSTAATLTGTQTLTNKTIDTASNTITGAVTLTGTQTLTNKTLTNPVIASVINNTLTSTTGDIIYASAANTPARLGIGSTGQILTVASGIPSWTTPAGGGGKVLQVVSATTTTEVTNATSTFADTTLTATITPTLNTSKILVLVSQNGCFKDSSNTALIMKLLRGSTSLGFLAGLAGYTGTALSMVFNAVTASYLDSPATTSATTYKTTFSSQANSSRAGVQVTGIGGEASMSMITLLEIGA